MSSDACQEADACREADDVACREARHVSCREADVVVDGDGRQAPIEGQDLVIRDLH